MDKLGEALRDLVAVGRYAADAEDMEAWTARIAAWWNVSAFDLQCAYAAYLEG